MLSSQNRPSVLSGTDGLPVFHGPEPLGLFEAEWCGIRRRVDVVVYGARSRSQPQVVLHFVAPSVSSRRERHAHS